MRRSVAALALAAFVVGAVACGDKPAVRGGDTPRRLDALAAAAAKVDEAGTFEFLLHVDMSGPEGFTGSGEGIFDVRREIGGMTMEISDAPGLPDEFVIEMVFGERDAFMKLPLQPGVPRGWFRIPSEPGLGVTGPDQFSQDPARYLEFLRYASDGDVEELGTEEVTRNAVRATHYRAEISIDDFLDRAVGKKAEAMREQLEASGTELGSIPVDAWIDEDGLPRRVTVDGAELGFVIGMDFLQYGVDVDVEPPKRFEELPI